MFAVASGHGEGGTRHREGADGERRKLDRPERSVKRPPIALWYSARRVADATSLSFASPSAAAPRERFRIMAKAVYPGSFDPPTHGHLDLIQRGIRLFDELVVAVAMNSEKTPLFTVDERKNMLRELTLPIKNVRIDSFDGLVVDYVRELKCSVILRGLRTVSDFEYEYQMALTNRSLAREVDTVFVMPNEKYSYVSSRLIKEAAALGGDVASFVPPLVLKLLEERLSRAKKKKK
jgi:pantetheine-phosphate adenylyltransferase